MKLLHLEDDDDIREISKMALELSGDFEVLQCSGGAEAVAAAPTFRPDVLLLDVMVPGMSGPSVLAEIRKIAGFETVPAIFMTARVQPSEIQAFKDLGAIDVIAKPFDPLTLGSQIKDSIQKAEAA